MELAGKMKKRTHKQHVSDFPLVLHPPHANATHPSEGWIEALASVQAVATTARRCRVRRSAVPALTFGEGEDREEKEGPRAIPPGTRPGYPSDAAGGMTTRSVRGPFSPCDVTRAHSRPTFACRAVATRRPCSGKSRRPRGVGHTRAVYSQHPPVGRGIGIPPR